MNQPAEDPDASVLLNICLLESAQVREDDRYSAYEISLLLTIALPLVGGVAAALVWTCPMGGPCLNQTQIPVWMYIVGPLFPIGLLVYSMLLASLGTIRTYYLRTLEEYIHNLSRQTATSASIPIPSWAHISLQVTAATRSGILPRMNWIVLYGIFAVLMLLIMVAALAKIPEWNYRLFSVLLDLSLFLIPGSLGAVNIFGGQRLWRQAVHELPARLQRTAAGFPDRPRQRERSFTSFLLLPRNQEELLKALFVPACILLPSLLDPAHIEPRTLGHCIIFYFTFEFIIYQGRYLWNDLRDRKRDCHKKVSKDRFPCSLVDDTRAIRIAALSVLVRLLVALAVLLILPLEESPWHLIFFAGIIVFAEIYERIRDWCNAASPEARVWPTRLLVLAVGLGYGLRSSVGLWLGGLEDLTGRTLGFVAGSLFGSMFVALTWALESTQDESVLSAAEKLHLIIFRQMVERSVGSRRVSSSERVLVGTQLPSAPWTLAGIASTWAFAIFAIHVAEANVWESAKAGPAPLISVSLTALSVALVAPLTYTIPLAAVSIGCAVSALKLLSIPMLPQGLTVVVLTMVPVLVAFAFRTMRYQDVPNAMTNLIRRSALFGNALFEWFVRAR